jgi:hypothetical protein
VPDFSGEISPARGASEKSGKERWERTTVNARVWAETLSAAGESAAACGRHPFRTPRLRPPDRKLFFYNC